MANFDDTLDDMAETVVDALDRHAEAVWAGLIAAGLAWDVALIRRGHRSLSEATRCPVGVAVIAGLLAHFAGLLGRFDPLHIVADRIPRKR